MKIPITDQFLWDVYSLLEKGNNVAEVLFELSPRSGRFWGFESPVFKKYRTEKNRKDFRKLIYYLRRKNYIKVKNLGSKRAIVLTKEGIGKALKASFNIEGKQKRKDGKWIMLTFDVPEKWRKSRDLLRSILYNLGYKMFQQSVWVSPYDVGQKTEDLLQHYSLEDFVKIFLIEEL